MKAAIMQPYLFPYIGYFQLMNAVDTFVYFDSVQYIARGWMNRNTIAHAGRTEWFTKAVRAAPQSLPINAREYVHDTAETELLKKKLVHSYAKARGFAEAFPVVCEILDFPEPNVALFNENALTRLAKAMAITGEFPRSTSIEHSTELKGADKIIDLCKRIGADHYINPIGGASLYSPDAFAAAGIRLSFLRTRSHPAALNDGHQHLSIIDMMMRDGIEGCRDRLGEFELLDQATALAATT